MTTKTTKNVTCYSQSNQGTWCQEFYNTSTRDARKRAKVLRKEGYKVMVSSMGKQVTPVGKAKITMVTVLPGNNNDTMNIPPVVIENI